MRLARPLRVRTVSTWLPATVETVDAAVARGALAADEAAATGYRQLPVSGTEAAPEMAVRAAGDCLRRAGCDPLDVDLLAHAWTYHQGHDFWSPAHFVADGVGAAHALPLGIQQMCNGGACALEVVAAWLQADPRLDAALVTTADRFCDPGFDRWRGDYGLWYGDGATAALLRSASTDGADGQDGPDDALELLAIVSGAASEMETMHRGRDPFSRAPRTHSGTVDIRRTKKAFLEAGGMEPFAKAVQERVPALIRASLAEAGIDPGDPRLRRVVLPRIGRTALESAYLPAVAQATPAPTLDLGELTGHLGAGDLIAGFAALVDQDLLAPGETALVLSAGGGFTWSSAVVRRPAPRRTRPRPPAREPAKEPARDDSRTTDSEEVAP